MQRVMVKDNTPWKEAVGKSGVITSKINTSNAGSIFLIEFADKDLNRYQSKKYGGFTFKENEFETIKY